MTFADKLSLNNLTFQYGFENAIEPFFPLPPFSFDISNITFNPEDATEPIIVADNPNYSPSGNSLGAGSSGGGGVGGAAAGAGAVGFAPAGLFTDAAHQWIPVQVFEAQGAIYLLAYSTRSSNVQNFPYARRLALYALNGNTFEYVNIPEISEWGGLSTNASSVAYYDRGNHWGLTESNGETTIMVAASHYPNLSSLIVDEKGYFILYITGSTITVDSIRQSDLIANDPRITSIGFQEPLLGVDYGDTGIPVTRTTLNGINANTDYPYLTQTTNGRNHYLIRATSAGVYTSSTGGSTNFSFGFYKESIYRKIFNDNGTIYAGFNIGVFTSDADINLRYNITGITNGNLFPKGNMAVASVLQKDGSYLWAFAGSVISDGITTRNFSYIHRPDRFTEASVLFQTIASEFSTGDAGFNIQSFSQRATTNIQGDLIHSSNTAGGSIVFLPRGGGIPVQIFDDLSLLVTGNLTLRTPWHTSPWGFLALHMTGTLFASNSMPTLVFVQPTVA